MNEIAKIMELDAEDVKAAIEELTSKKPLASTGQMQVYDGIVDNLPVYKLPSDKFQSVRLTVDEKGRLIKNVEEIERRHDLLKGECSCRDSNPTRNFIVMGDSGTGKTELIDILVNFLLGVEICDKFRYSITEGADHISKRQNRLKQVSKSLGNVTKEVIIYHVPAEFINQDRSSSVLPTCINLIDTPGYGSNAGNQGNQLISQVL